MIRNYDLAKEATEQNGHIYAFSTQNSDYFSFDLEEITKAYKKNKAKTKTAIGLLQKQWNEKYHIWSLRLVKYLNKIKE